MERAGRLRREAGGEPEARRDQRDLLLQGKYASADNIPLIGPFAEWEIRIESGKHKNLDRTKITSICLDFHILSKAITTGPLPPAPAR